MYWLTNSKDNSYHVSISNIGKSQDSFLVHFLDMNKIVSNTRISKVDFYKAETMNIECNYHVDWYGKNRKVYLNKGFVFVKLNDTIIEDAMVKRYKSTTRKKYRRKKKNNFDYIHMIEPNTDFHMPSFMVIDSYNKWLKNKFQPNGIKKQILAINTKTGDTSYMSNMLSYTKYEKRLRISTDCNE